MADQHLERDEAQASQAETRPAALQRSTEIGAERARSVAVAPGDEDVDAFRRSMARGRARVPVALVALVVVPLLALGGYAVYVLVELCSGLWGAITKGRVE